MNEVMEAIRNRRAVKKYTDRPVEKELIDQLVEAALWAPTGRGSQSPIVVAITDKEVRDRLAAANAAVLGTNSDTFYGAPAVLVVLVDKSAPTWAYDGPIAAENIMLAAHSLGLCSCWIHRAKEVFEQPEWKEFLKSIGAEGDYEGVANIIVGYGDMQPVAKERKEGRAFLV